MTGCKAAGYTVVKVIKNGGSYYMFKWILRH